MPLIFVDFKHSQKTLDSILYIFYSHQNQTISEDENQILNKFPDLQGIITVKGETLLPTVQRVQIGQVYRKDLRFLLF